MIFYVEDDLNQLHATNPQGSLTNSPGAPSERVIGEFRLRRLRDLSKGLGAGSIDEQTFVEATGRIYDSFERSSLSQVLDAVLGEVVQLPEAVDRATGR